jgi:hypothetical protein
MIHRYVAGAFRNHYSADEFNCLASKNPHRLMANVWFVGFVVVSGLASGFRDVDSHHEGDVPLLSLPICF